MSFYISPNTDYLMMVLTNINNNNNKFYELSMKNDFVTARYGRVGLKGTTTEVGKGFHALENKAREKYNKGYRIVDTIKTDSKSAQQNHSLSKVAYRDIIPSEIQEGQSVTHEQLKDFIDFLISINKHHISETSGKMIEVKDDGLVKTAVGVVTKNNIRSALKVLEKLAKAFEKKGEKYIEDSKNLSMLEEYLMLIPQDAGRSSGWEKHFLVTEKQFNKQYEFLEALSNAVDLYETLIEQKNQETDKTEETEEIPTVFQHKLKPVTDKKILDRIREKFNVGKKSNHQSYHFELKEVYEIVNENSKESRFEKIANKLGNVQELWHGTQGFNVLSILKSGFVIPKSNAFNVTGRMFGDGVYFSNQSTKSLNYSSGYWGGGRQNKTFMFLSDVVMGKEFQASHKKAPETLNNTERGREKGFYPVKNYDSTHAYGGFRNVCHGGDIYQLVNDEMIVYDLEQIKLRYLCVFE